MLLHTKREIQHFARPPAAACQLKWENTYIPMKCTCLIFVREILSKFQRLFIFHSNSNDTDTKVQNPVHYYLLLSSTILALLSLNYHLRLWSVEYTHEASSFSKYIAIPTNLFPLCPYKHSLNSEEPETSMKFGDFWINNQYLLQYTMTDIHNCDYNNIEYILLCIYMY